MQTRPETPPIKATDDGPTLETPSAEQYEALRQTAQKLFRSAQIQAILREIAEAAVLSPSTDELYALVYRTIARVLPTRFFHINLVDESANEVVVAFRAAEVDFVPDRRPIGKGLTEYVMRQGHAMYLPPEELVRLREQGEYDIGTASSAEMRHYLGAPLIGANGKSFGVITLFVTGEAEFFLQDDVEVLSIIASQVSMAISRKRAEEQLRLAASVFTHAREGIMITDADGKIIDVNETFSQITGYAKREVLGQNPRLLKSGRQDPAFYHMLWRNLIDQGHWTGEIWNRKKNGECYPQMLTISTVRDGKGDIGHFVAVFSDITALKDNEKRLEHLAHYDALTSLPNRVLLADRMKQAMMQTLRRRQLLAVVYLDLDGFKSVNDRYGHDVGDQLLVNLSARLKLALREGDTLARLGGDEFVAMLLDLPDTSTCLPMLERLLAVTRQSIEVGELDLEVSASLGVTFYPQDDDIDADQLLRQADQAMYQAKLAGKGRFHLFDAEQDRNVRGHHESIDRIRRALEEREFVLYYQPKVNTRTGALIGVEALIRWQHPERGLLAPAVFLPVIEDHPLSIEIGEWVIDSALSQIRHWREAGLHIPISVNVGARQLLQKDFTASLRRILARYPETQPGDLNIEVLETSALEDLAQVSRIIDECRNIGVRFSLDDFGTGYSSLTYLKRLSVDQLKVDQSFVRGMLDDPDDLAILGGVLSLAEAFSRDVIAEGVETVAHGAMLLQLGCELAQGYGIARPMPAENIPGWIQVWRPDPAWSNLPPIRRDDLPLLFASIEHRAWIAAIDAMFRGERETLPLIHHHCRFSTWLETEGRKLHGDHPAFQLVTLLHQ